MDTFPMERFRTMLPYLYEFRSRMVCRFITTTLERANGIALAGTNMATDYNGSLGDVSVFCY
jgi:hypothetical protein